MSYIQDIHDVTQTKHVYYTLYLIVTQCIVTYEIAPYYIVTCTIYIKDMHDVTQTKTCILCSILHSYTKHSYILHSYLLHS